MGIKVHNPREERLGEGKDITGRVTKVTKNYLVIEVPGKRPQKIWYNKIAGARSVNDPEKLQASIRALLLETALKQKKDE